MWYATTTGNHTYVCVYTYRINLAWKAFDIATIFSLQSIENISKSIVDCFTTSFMFGGDGIDHPWVVYFNEVFDEVCPTFEREDMCMPLLCHIQILSKFL